jgi:hypothetical protein
MQEELMQPRPERSDSAHGDERDVAMQPAREGASGERMHEIRRRLADDAYRNPEVAERIARRILSRREL